MAKKDRTSENKVRVVKSENSFEEKSTGRVLSSGLQKYFAAALSQLDFIEYGDPSDYLMKKFGVDVPKTELSSIWIPPEFKEEETDDDVLFSTFLSEPKPQLVLADPGCGKSTLSRYLTCDFIKKYKESKQDYFGIFVPLARFRKSNKSIEEAISFCAAEYLGLQDDTIVIQELASNVRNACIIFDGYDESPPSRVDNQEKNPIATRREIVGMISGLKINAMVIQDGIANQRFIVLCRGNDYRSYPRECNLGLRPLIMQRFSAPNMHLAVENWHKSAIDRIREINSTESSVVPNMSLRLTDIQSGLREHSDLAEICLTPFMLNAFQTVDLDSKDLPSSVSQLCWRAVNWFFIEKHHEPDKVALVQEFGESILSIISEIGYSIQECIALSEKPKVFDKAELRKLTEKIFKQDGISKKYEEEILDQKITQVVSFLKRGHGILVNSSSNEDDVFDFVHSVFREVIAGRKLLSYEVVQLTEYALKWGWHAPIRYWAGFKAIEPKGQHEISSLVDELCQDQYKDNIQAILACGEMLVEVVSCVKADKIPSGIKNHIKNTKSKLCLLLKQDSLLLVQRIRIGDILAILRDPRIELSIEKRVSIISGGTYSIGRDQPHNPKINPAKYLVAPASPIVSGNLKDFTIGNFLVTNSEYKEFIDAGGYKKAEYWQNEIGLKWMQGDSATLELLVQEAFKVGQLHLISELAGRRILESEIPDKCKEMIRRSRPLYWTDPAFNRSNQPVVGINWWEAMAYCKWLEETLKEKKIIENTSNIRLPIETEWETVAKLCGSGNHYPWMNEEDPSKCALLNTTFNSDNNSPILSAKIRSSGVGLFDFVKCNLPIYDLVGNVWEWTGSKVHKYSQESFKQTLELQGMENRISRGSSWLSKEEESSQITFRSFDPPYFAYEDLGFRIVIF